MALAGIIAAVALLASPYVIAATTTTTTTNPSTTSSSGTGNHPQWQQGMAMGMGGFQGPESGFPGQAHSQNAPSLTVGQTITVTSTQGRYQVVGTPNDNGTASGTVTFAVTGSLSQGYTLSITGGSITIGSTSYTISSGSAQTGRLAADLSGQGTTTPSGQFLLRGTATGSFAGTMGHLLIDFQTGSTEYAVSLSGTVSS